MFLKPYNPDTSGFNKNIRFRCIQKKNTSELHKKWQSRCILTSNLSKTSHINQIKQPANPHNPDSGRISAQVITESTVFRGLYTDSRKRMKASRPSGVHLYTPASSSTCRNTLPVSSLMMSIALSALNSGWFGRNSSTQSA